MEQQDTVQSVKELGEFAQETKGLEMLDVSAPYEFRDGIYYCEGLEGGYTSLVLLRRAWQTKLKATKMKEAKSLASGVGKASKNSPAAKEKARKEYVKWHKAKVE